MKKLVCRFLCLGIVLAVSMNLVGCSDDDGPVGTLYFPRDVCMVDKPGGTASVEFTAVNIVKLNITDTPEGWTVTADLQTSRMTVTAPASDVIVQITARTTESGAIDLELTPRSGNYTILFGRLDDAEQKLDKLLRFYREGLGKAGWDRYRTINVKYAGQVVCTEW